jgi:hypothetical protein
MKSRHSMYWDRKTIHTGDHWVFTCYTVDGRRLKHLQGFCIKGRDFDEFNDEVEAQGFTLKDSGIYCETEGKCDLLYSRWTMVKQDEEE